MISLKELRIGNLVKCTVHLPIGFNRPPLFTSRITEIRDAYVETDEGIHKYRDIAPIELTEDILLKSGGNKVSDNEIIFENENRSANIEDFSLIIDSGKYYLSNKHSKELSIPIESVHQFQNIYYALKGKDINIVLS